MKLRWIAVITVALAWPLQATTVKRLDFDGLVATAHTIVVGTVETSQTYWGPEKRLILTRHTIQVEETLKGARTSTVDVTTIGGTLDGITLYVAGMPGFVEREDTVVFLEGPYWTLVGLGQGKFSIDGGIVSNDISNLEFIGNQTGTRLEMSLDLFRDEIRRRVRPF